MVTTDIPNDAVYQRLLVQATLVGTAHSETVWAGASRESSLRLWEVLVQSRTSDVEAKGHRMCCRDLRALCRSRRSRMEVNTTETISTNIDTTCTHTHTTRSRTPIQHTSHSLPGILIISHHTSTSSYHQHHQATPSGCTHQTSTHSPHLVRRARRSLRQPCMHRQGLAVRSHSSSIRPAPSSLIIVVIIRRCTHGLDPAWQKSTGCRFGEGRT